MYKRYICSHTYNDENALLTTQLPGLSILLHHILFMLLYSSTGLSYKLNKDRKQKSKCDIKMRRTKANRARQIESKQGTDDYSSHDSGKNATEVVTDVSPD